MHFQCRNKMTQSLADQTSGEWYESLMKNFTWIPEGSFTLRSLPCILRRMWYLVEKWDDKSAAWIQVKMFSLYIQTPVANVSKICVANFRDRLTGKFCVSPEWWRGVLNFPVAILTALVIRAMRACFIYRFITLSLFTRVHVFRSIIIGANVPFDPFVSYSARCVVKSYQ